MTKLRLAIVGAGPAGIYAADILLKAERKFDVSIDLFEQLPAPYGLVRYGVAPDHPRIKGIITALREVLDRGDIRLFGNVRFGEDITLEDLKHHYNAVIFATGAIRDAGLDIPGIDAIGSYGAADFVSWFDGHPDVPREWPLDAASVAVIGNGNVALDVSRMLAKHADDLLLDRSARQRVRGPQGQPRHRRARVRPPRSCAGEVHAARAARARRAARRRHGRLRRGLRLRRRVEGGDREQQAGHGDRPRAAVLAQAPVGQQRRGRGIPPSAPALLREAARSDHGCRWPGRRIPLGAHASRRRGRSRRHRRDPRGRRSRRSTAPSATSARRCPASRSTSATASSRTTRVRRCARTRTTACPACTRPAGSSADRSASSATPSPTRWRPCATSSTTRARGGSPPTRPRRRSRRCSPSAACAGPTSRAGTVSTSTRSALGAPHDRARIKVVPRDEMVDISRGE